MKDKDFWKYWSDHHLVVVDVSMGGIKTLEGEWMPKGSGQQLIKNIQTQVSDCIKQGGEVIYITEWDIPTIPELMEWVQNSKTFNKNSQNWTFEEWPMLDYFMNEHKARICYTLVWLSACICVPHVAKNLEKLGHSVRILVGCTLWYWIQDSKLEHVKRSGNNEWNLDRFFFPNEKSPEKKSLLDYLHTY